MNRNRRNIIASIFGFGALAKAQSAVGVGGYGQQPKMYTEQEAFPHGHEEYKPLPNQCPIPTCRTMAKPYVRPTWDILKNCKPVDGSNYVVSCDPTSTPYGDMQLLTRCSRCNNAFFVDAEK